jgi:hypothetical protein
MAGIAAELLHPGIWSEWLFREQWPYRPLCANLSTALALVSDRATALPSWVIYSISISLGFLVWVVGVKRYRLESLESQIMWAWLVAPFYAPYGFLSDHVTLVFPVSYFAGRLGHQLGTQFQARLLLSLSLLSIVGLLLPANPFTGESLSWFIFAPGALIAVAVALNRAARELHSSTI